MTKLRDWFDDRVKDAFEPIATTGGPKRQLTKREERTEIFNALNLAEQKIKDYTIEKWAHYFTHDNGGNQSCSDVECEKIHNIVKSKINDAIIFCDIFNTADEDRGNGIVPNLPLDLQKVVLETQKERKLQNEKLRSKIDEYSDKFDEIFTPLKEILSTRDYKLIQSEKIKIIKAVNEGDAALLEILAQIGVDEKLSGALKSRLNKQLKMLIQECDIDIANETNRSSQLFNRYKKNFVNFGKMAQEICKKEGAKPEWFREFFASDTIDALECGEGDEIGAIRLKDSLFSAGKQKVFEKSSLIKLKKQGKEFEYWASQNWECCCSKIHKEYNKLKNELGFVWFAPNIVNEFCKSKNCHTAHSLDSLNEEWGKNYTAFVERVINNNEPAIMFCKKDNDEQIFGHETLHILGYGKSHTGLELQKNDVLINEALTEYLSQKAFNPNYTWDAETECDYQPMIYLLHDFFDDIEEDAKGLYLGDNIIVNKKIKEMLGDECIEELEFTVKKFTNSLNVLDETANANKIGVTSFVYNYTTMCGKSDTLTPIYNKTTKILCGDVPEKIREAMEKFMFCTTEFRKAVLECRKAINESRASAERK